MTGIGELKQRIIALGADDAGFCRAHDECSGLSGAVSIVVKLSRAIVDEIHGAPTHTYFNHYRSVNAYIDGLLLKTGKLLEREGYKYVTVAASQSINIGGDPYRGRCSHRKIACLCGLGGIGRSNMFLHKDFGPAVRLGTVFTDMPMPDNTASASPCIKCGRCVAACPSGALTGADYTPSATRSDMIDVRCCSEYMKDKFQQIGRGAVCGVCMAVCPVGKK